MSAPDDGQPDYMVTESRQVLGARWRRDHAVAGDVSLRAAEREMDEIHIDSAYAAAMAAIAQAHYAAANVRARPE